MLGALNSHLFANEPNTAPISLAPEERRFLGTLYWNKKNASSFVQGLTDTELTYSIDILVKNIEFLQYTLVRGNDYPGKKELLIAGGFLTALYAASSSFLAHEYYKKHYEFISGTFKNAVVSKAKINDLSSIHFSFKEKKYLRQFKAENIIIGDWWYGISEWDKERTEAIMSQLSRRDREKVKYYALKETVNFHKRGILGDAFMPALFITATIGILSATLYGILYHEKILQNQLEDCKNLYQIFKSEQEHRLSLIPNSV